MSILSNRLVRCASKVGNPFSAGLQDFRTGQTMETVRGNATRFEFVLLDPAGAVLDISEVESLNLKIQPDQTTDGILADQTLADVVLDNTVTLETWADGTKAHAAFDFTNAEMNLDPVTTKRTLWLVVTAILYSGKEVTVAAGDLFIHEDNNTAADLPPENLGTTITLEQADARYLQMNSGGDSGIKIVENGSGGKELAIWNETRSVYQIVRIIGAVGSETMTYTDIA